jgi:hypothetical protein
MGHGHAVVAAGGRDHARGGDVAQEQVREGAPRLEGPRVLQELELQEEGDPVPAQVRPLHLHHRGEAEVRPQAGGGGGHRLAGEA